MQILNKKHTATVTAKKLRAKKYAFNENIREVLFSRNTEIIGESAFYDCRNLKEVTLPHSLKIIEEDSFSLCESLEEIKLPENLEELGERSFFWSGIKTLVIPPKITGIKDFTFSNCRKLQKATINENCVELGNGAFANCMELREINIPNTVTVLGKECFKGCSSLKEIKLPDSIKVLPRNFFENCQSLEMVCLPKSLEIIEAECFSGCSNLKTIIFPDALKEIGEKAFYRCESLENIRLPKSTTHLDDHAFASCKNLTTLQIEGDLLYAGAALFSNCTVNPPKNTERMFVTSFLKNSDYKLCPTVKIPESVKELKLGFKGLLPYSYLTKNKSCFSHILTLEKYNAKVFISENYYSENDKILENGIFDFLKYDTIFESAENYEMPIIATFRLSYPVELQENHRNLYQREIIENGKEAAIFAVKTNEENLLKYLMDNADFDTSFCEELYSIVSEQGLPNLLQILSNKQNNTGLNEINSLFEELML